METNINRMNNMEITDISTLIPTIVSSSHDGLILLSVGRNANIMDARLNSVGMTALILVYLWLRQMRISITALSIARHIVSQTRYLSDAGFTCGPSVEFTTANYLVRTE